MCDKTNEQLKYPPVSPRLAQHTLTVRSCYRTHGALTFKERVHREIVPPRETVAIARVAIAIVGRGGWGSLSYTVANEGIDNIANGPVNNMSFFIL